MRDLIAARLPLTRRPTELREGFKEERRDVVRLQPAGLGAFHLLAHPGHAAGVHGVMCQGTLVEQCLELRAIHRMSNGLGEFGAYLGALAVANRLQQQIPQRPTLELELAKHVKDLTAEGLACLVELVEQGAVHIAFTGSSATSIQRWQTSVWPTRWMRPKPAPGGWGSTAGRSSPSDGHVAD